LARDRSSLGSRLGASATPESVFSPLESRYSQAGANLAGQQGQQELAGFDKSNEQDLQRANLLERLLGKKEAFGQEQNNQIQGALGARGNAIGDYTDTLSGTSTFDDILSVLSTGADLAGEIAPFFKKNKLPTPKPNNTGTDMVSRTPV
jgi:hypothetical protein